jgi:hypothetical protein
MQTISPQDDAVPPGTAVICSSYLQSGLPGNEAYPWYQGDLVANCSLQK